MRSRLALALLLLPAARAADPPSRYATLDGHKVHYRSVGSGSPAVVFIHGWTCDMTFWRLQSDAIAAKHRVLLVDLPGHGQSDKPPIDYTLELFARAVDAVLRDAGVERAVLVGHSMGGPVGLKFLRLYPKKASGYVAVDARFPVPPEDPAAIEKAKAQFAAFAALYRKPDYRATMEKMVDAMFAPITSTAVREEIRSKMTATPQHVLASAMESMSEVLTWKPDPIDVPALAILANNPGLRPETEQYARRIFPRLDYRPWDGVGHFLMMEKPEEFNRALLDFLAGISKASAR